MSRNCRELKISTIVETNFVIGEFNKLPLLRREKIIGQVRSDRRLPDFARGAGELLKLLLNGDKGTRKSSSDTPLLHFVNKALDLHVDAYCFDHSRDNLVAIASSLAEIFRRKSIRSQHSLLKPIEHPKLKR